MPIKINLPSLTIKKDKISDFEESFTGTKNSSKPKYIHSEHHTIKDANEQMATILQIADQKNDDIQNLLNYVDYLTNLNSKKATGLTDTTKLHALLASWTSDQINQDYESFSIKRPNKKLDYHYYLKNRQAFAPVSPTLLYETAQLFPAFQIKSSELSYLNLDKYILDFDQEADEFVTCLNDNELYQKPLIWNIHGLGELGQVYTHINYYALQIIKNKKIDFQDIDHFVFVEKPLDLHATLMPYTAFLRLVPLQLELKKPNFSDAVNASDLIVLGCKKTELIEHFQNQELTPLFVSAIQTKEEQTKVALDYLNLLSNLADNYSELKDLETRINYLLVRFLGGVEQANQVENIIDMKTMSLIYTGIKKLSHKKGLSAYTMQIARTTSMLIELSERLDALSAQKKNLKQFHAENQTIKNLLNQATTFSNQQKQIILSEHPLIIGQAGAGSGKSHTILGRIEYLNRQNVDLRKVLVLSFTNTAANNITQRWSDVQSKTIASMLDMIYQKNYNHQLSQPGTVVNAMKLLVPTNSYFTSLGFEPARIEMVVQLLTNVLYKLDTSRDRKGASSSKTNNALLKELSNIINVYYNETIAILDAIGQTTLEIEPIIVLNLLRNPQKELKMPKTLKNIEFIITDESQDISAFEYIVLIELVLYYRSQLLIVGDGSQTLYEFRSADPRCLSTLEQSGIFQTYKLDTNYRSKQEILSYANEFLKVIEANKNAKIQLHANELIETTEESFKKHVHLINLEKKHKAIDRIDSIFSDTNLHVQIIDKLFKNEQVAFLAWTRKEKDYIKKCLEELFEQKQIKQEVVDITNNRMIPKTYLSRLAGLINNQKHNQTLLTLLTAYASKNIHLVTLKQSLLDQWAKLVLTTIPYKNENAEKIIYQEIEKMINTPQFEAIIHSFINKQCVFNQMIGDLKKLMIDKEIEFNNLRAAYFSQNQQQNINDLCVVSTIHGAKGLEFDNVFIVYNENASRTPAQTSREIQEELRLYFVAFSRAKKEEWIINFCQKGVAASSSDYGMIQTPIRSAYLRTIDTLKANSFSQAELFAN